MASRTQKNTPLQPRTRKSWKDIDQSVKPKSRSSAAAKRVWADRFKILAVVVAVVGVVVAALQLRVFVEKGPELLSKAGESLPIQHVNIETDGSLEPDWLERYLDISETENLLSVDLESLKAKLEMIGQVKSAKIERRFPDSLNVSVEERFPVTRLLAQDSDGNKLHLFVDDQGFVFESKRMDRSVARSLPYLKGVALKRTKEGFSRIGEMEDIAKLLEETRVIAPHIYETWRVVSPDKNSMVKVKNHRGAETLFSMNEDVRSQLSKLDYIMDYYRGRLSKQIAYVDLTLGDQVPVRSQRAAQ